MKKVLIALVGLVAVFLVVGMILPNQYTASTTYEFKHPKASVHGIIGDLNTWKEWGPWMADDPEMKIELVGENGVGAKQIWTSRQAGNGSLTFTAWDPESGIKYDLAFEGYPPASAEFKYEDIDGGVKVYWTMNGSMEVPVVGGYFAMFFKNMISSSFQQGMQNIDNILSKKM